MLRFKKIDTPIEDLIVLETLRIEDNRGYLSRLFCAEELEQLGWSADLVQINSTKTLFKGTIRGFHFQNPPYSEYKYVRCIRGEVYDVALDLRRGSKTFLQTHTQILSEDNNISFLLPPGVAHGFQSLTDNAELLYFHSQPAMPEYDSGLNPLDPKVCANWPQESSNISETDANRTFLTDAHLGVSSQLPSF